MCGRESDKFQRAAWTQEWGGGSFQSRVALALRTLPREMVSSPSLGVLKQMPKGLWVVLEKRFVFTLVGG